MKEKMIGMLIGIVIERLDTETFKKFADMALDFVEDAVAKSENKYDDAVVLPLCKTIRAAFDIADNDVK